MAACRREGRLAFRCRTVCPMAQGEEAGGSDMAALYKRGKIFWARAQRQGRDRRTSLKTANRAIAEKRLRVWLEELDAIAWGDKPRRSWEEASKKFIHEHLTVIKPRAAERYGTSLKHLSEHFGGKMLHQITSAEMSEFEQIRRADGV